MAELLDRREMSLGEPRLRRQICAKTAKLRPTVHAHGHAAGRHVLADAFEAGQDTGRRFDYRPGIGHTGR